MMKYRRCMVAACLLAAYSSAKTDNSLAGLLGNMDIFFNLDNQNKKVDGSLEAENELNFKDPLESENIAPQSR